MQILFIFNLSPPLFNWRNNYDTVSQGRGRQHPFILHFDKGEFPLPLWERVGVRGVNDFMSFTIIGLRNFDTSNKSSTSQPLYNQ
jgi:hypothetical protein